MRKWYLTKGSQCNRITNYGVSISFDRIDGHFVEAYHLWLKGELVAVLDKEQNVIVEMEE